MLILICGGEQKRQQLLQHLDHMSEDYEQLELVIFSVGLKVQNYSIAILVSSPDSFKSSAILAEKMEVIDRDICWGHFCRWLNHIKMLFTLKKCCDHKAFCKQKRKGYIQVAYENGSDHLVTDLKNNVLTEINGITLCTDPKGKNGAYKNRGEHIYKGNRADSLWGPLLFQ